MDKRTIFASMGNNTSVPKSKWTARRRASLESGRDRLVQDINSDDAPVACSLSDKEHATMIINTKGRSSEGEVRHTRGAAVHVPQSPSTISASASVSTSASSLPSPSPSPTTNNNTKGTVSSTKHRRRHSTLGSLPISSENENVKTRNSNDNHSNNRKSKTPSRRRFSSSTRSESTGRSKLSSSHSNSKSSPRPARKSMFTLSSLSSSLSSSGSSTKGPTTTGSSSSIADPTTTVPTTNSERNTSSTSNPTATRNNKSPRRSTQTRSLAMQMKEGIWAATHASSKSPIRSASVQKERLESAALMATKNDNHCSHHGGSSSSGSLNGHPQQSARASSTPSLRTSDKGELSPLLELLSPHKKRTSTGSRSGSSTRSCNTSGCSSSKSDSKSIFQTKSTGCISLSGITTPTKTSKRSSSNGRSMAHRKPAESLTMCRRSSLGNIPGGSVVTSADTKCHRPRRSDCHHAQHQSFTPNHEDEPFNRDTQPRHGNRHGGQRSHSPSMPHSLQAPQQPQKHQQSRLSSHSSPISPTLSDVASPTPSLSPTSPQSSMLDHILPSNCKFTVRKQSSKHSHNRRSSLSSTCSTQSSSSAGAPLGGITWILSSSSVQGDQPQQGQPMHKRKKSSRRHSLEGSVPLSSSLRSVSSCNSLRSTEGSDNTVKHTPATESTGHVSRRNVSIHCNKNGGGSTGGAFVETSLESLLVTKKKVQKGTTSATSAKATGDKSARHHRHVILMNDDDEDYTEDDDILLPLVETSHHSIKSTSKGSKLEDSLSLTSQSSFRISMSYNNGSFTYNNTIQPQHNNNNDKSHNNNSSSTFDLGSTTSSHDPTNNHSSSNRALDGGSSHSQSRGGGPLKNFMLLASSSYNSTAGETVSTATSTLSSNSQSIATVCSTTSIGGGVVGTTTPSSSSISFSQSASQTVSSPTISSLFSPTRFKGTCSMEGSANGTCHSDQSSSSSIRSGQKRVTMIRRVNSVRDFSEDFHQSIDTGMELDPIVTTSPQGNHNISSRHPVDTPINTAANTTDNVSRDRKHSGVNKSRKTSDVGFMTQPDPVRRRLQRRNTLDLMPNIPSSHCDSSSGSPIRSKSNDAHHDRVNQPLQKVEWSMTKRVVSTYNGHGNLLRSEQTRPSSHSLPDSMIQNTDSPSRHEQVPDDLICSGMKTRSPDTEKKASLSASLPSTSKRKKGDNDKKKTKKSSRKDKSGNPKDSNHKKEKKSKKEKEKKSSSSSTPRKKKSSSKSSPVAEENHDLSSGTLSSLNMLVPGCAVMDEDDYSTDGSTVGTDGCNDQDRYLLTDTDEFSCTYNDDDEEEEDADDLDEDVAHSPRTHVNIISPVASPV